MTILAVKHTVIKILVMITVTGDQRWNSPQIGLHWLVTFSSKKNDSGQTGEEKFALPVPVLGVVSLKVISPSNDVLMELSSISE